MNLQASLDREKSLPALDTEVLKTFVAIVELRNFSKAAKQVYRTPSAVSMQVKKLEDILGASLFKRDARSVELTPDGEILLGYARRILALNNEMLSRFLTPDMTGNVRLGSPGDYGSFLLPTVLRRFASSHPNVTVDVVVDTSEFLMQQLAEGTLDVILVTSTPETPLEQEELVLLEEPIVWVGMKGGCAWEQDPAPVAMWEHGCAWREKAVKSLEISGKKYRAAYMSANAIAQRSAVIADLAIAAFPASFIDPPLIRLGQKQGLPDPGFYQIRLKSRPALDKVGEAVQNHVIASFEAFKAGELECLPL